MDVTLFELHVDDATFTAHAPFSGSRSDDDEAAGADTDDETGGRGRLVGALLALGLMAVLVWFKKRGGSGEVSLADAEEAVASE